MKTGDELKRANRRIVIAVIVLAFALAGALWLTTWLRARRSGTGLPKLTVRDTLAVA